WGTVTVRRPEFRVQRATQVMVRLAPVSVVCWLLGTAPPLLAQQDAAGRALDLERRGNYAAAAEAYRAILGDHPGDLAALLGLERSLTPLNRVAEMVPILTAALGRGAASAAVCGVAVRVWTAARLPDSA